MAGCLVAGAALGAAFERLSVSVVHATRKVALFRSDLNRLNSTLSSINLVIDDINSLNEELKHPHHETEAFTKRLSEGERLVQRCSEVKSWNVFKRLYYSKKLSDLKDLLLDFFQIVVAAHQFRESKRISVVVTRLEDKINELTTLMLNRTAETGVPNNCSNEIDVQNAVEACGENVQIEGSLTYVDQS